MVPAVMMDIEKWRADISAVRNVENDYFILHAKF